MSWSSNWKWAARTLDLDFNSSDNTSDLKDPAAALPPWIEAWKRLRAETVEARRQARPAQVFALSTGNL